MRALIIEDETMIAWMLEEVLRGLDYDAIDIAASERDAVEAASANCPDLVVANCRLEDGSGIEAVRQICSDKHIPAVFVTGDEVAVRAAIEDPVVVAKPPSVAALAEAIAQAKAGEALMFRTA